MYFHFLIYLSRLNWKFWKFFSEIFHFIFIFNFKKKHLNGHNCLSLKVFWPQLYFYVLLSLFLAHNLFGSLICDLLSSFKIYHKRRLKNDVTIFAEIMFTYKFPLHSTILCVSECENSCSEHPTSCNLQYPHSARVCSGGKLVKKLWNRPSVNWISILVLQMVKLEWAWNEFVWNILPSCFYLL